MTIIITFANQKGGTAKTTSVINVAASLAEKNYHVLVIDMDPQASLTTGLMGTKSLAENYVNVYELLIDDEDEYRIDDVIQEARPNIDILSASIKLAAAEGELFNAFYRESRLKTALENLETEYDFILIDSPPSLGLLFINAFVCADHVIVPMSCEFYSLVGVALLLQSLERLKKNMRVDVGIIGVLPARFDKRTRHSNDIIEQIKEQVDCPVFHPVRNSTVINNAAASAMTLIEFAPEHPATEDYQIVTEEILKELYSD